MSSFLSCLVLQPDSRSKGEVRTLKSAAKFKRRITFRFNRRLFVVPKVLISLYRDTHFHLFSFPKCWEAFVCDFCLSSLLCLFPEIRLQPFAWILFVVWISIPISISSVICSQLHFLPSNSGSACSQNRGTEERGYGDTQTEKQRQRDRGNKEGQQIYRSQSKRISKRNTHHQFWTIERMAEGTHRPGNQLELFFPLVPTCLAARSSSWEGLLGDEMVVCFGEKRSKNRGISESNSNMRHKMRVFSIQS